MRDQIQTIIKYAKEKYSHLQSNQIFTSQDAVCFLNVIFELKDKLHRRNQTINNLRREIGELKEKNWLLSKSVKSLGGSPEVINR